MPNDIILKAAPGKQSTAIYSCRPNASFTAANYTQAVDLSTGSIFPSTSQSAQSRINDIKMLLLSKLLLFKETRKGRCACKLKMLQLPG